MTMRDVLITLDEKYNHNFADTLNAIKNKEKVTETDVVRDDNNELVTLIDADYPNNLKNVVHPPFVIKRKDLSLYHEMFNLLNELECDTNELPSDYILESLQEHYEWQLATLKRIKELKKMISK